MPGAPSRTDLEYEILYNPDFVPTRRRMVSVKTILDSTGRRHLMRNHASGVYYHLDEHPYIIWKLVDGIRKVPEIIEFARKKKIEAKETYGILLFFAESGALISNLDEKRKERFRVVSAFRVEIPVVRQSELFLRRIHTALNPLFRRPLPWIALGFIAVSGILFAIPFTSIFADPTNFRIAGSVVLGLFIYNFVILTPVIAIHEMSHGLALVHYGGRPGEMGFGLLYFGLMFYTDVSDSWSLTRSQRVVVMLAGILSTVLIGSSLLVILYLGLVPSQSFAAKLILITTFWCFYSALWNLAPTFETDGYYTLADLLNMPELKTEANNYLSRSIKKLLRRPLPQSEKVEGKRKRILVGYLVLSLSFLAYVVFVTLRLAYYMAVDVSYYLPRLALAQTTGFNDAVVAIVSVFYFILSISGYSLLLHTAAKKAVIRALKFESIHDRNLAVFTYLPSSLPSSLSTKLEEKMRAVAKRLSSNYLVGNAGPIRLAILRMGSSKIAMEQLRGHLRRTELAFSSVYQRFLLKHHKDIHDSVGIFSPKKRDLTELVERMGREISSGGSNEAKTIARQEIARQYRSTIYLLNSAFSTVWTIEVPPADQQELQAALMPSSLAEDFSITDLYGDVEEFKKRTIYGYDTLYALGVDASNNLQNTLTHPETYHVIHSLEPVKGRLLFVGRTEKIEGRLPEFAPIFIGQIWAGYLDNHLSEINLALSVFGNIQLPTAREIQSLRDGELTVLRRNLSQLISGVEHATEVLEESRRNLQLANSNIKKLSERIQSLGTPGLELLEDVFRINRENLDSLPDRLSDLEILMKNLATYLSQTQELVANEHIKRETPFKKRQQNLILIYPLFLAASIVGILLGAIGVGAGGGRLLVGIGIVIELMYGTIYLLNRRHFFKIGRYRTSVFEKIERPLFAVAQVLFRFVSTADILRPGDIPLSEVEHFLEREPKSKSKSENKTKTGKRRE